MTTLDSPSRDPAPGRRPGPSSVAPPVLLDAFLALSGDLDRTGVLTRVVDAAASLTGARYGALGIYGTDGHLAQFLTTGIDERTRREIGAEPRGDGILGLLRADPRPLRLPDLNRHPAALGMPPGHPAMGTFLGVPIRVRDTVVGYLYLTEKAGADSFTDHDEELALALANAAGMVIDNLRAYGLSERRRQWLEAAADLAEDLRVPIDLSSALAAITRRARATARASAAAIVQFPADSHPVISAEDGFADGDARAVVRQIIEQARSAEAGAVALDVDLGARLGGGQAVVLPFRAHLADPGSLVVVFDSAALSTYEEREFLATFVDQAGLALDRAQAVADREQLVVVLDRARIARDLHDVVIQRLFATGLKLQGLRSASAEALGPLIEGLVDDLDLTIKDVRSTVFALTRPADSLRGEIHRLLGDYAEVLGFTPAFHSRGPLDLVVSAPISAHLLAVLREGFSNIARHAGARQVTVEIDVSAQDVVLRLADDGTGIPDRRVESGLANVRERAELLGGSLRVVAGEGGGTTLTWTCPLTDPD